MIVWALVSSITLTGQIVDAGSSDPNEQFELAELERARQLVSIDKLQAALELLEDFNIRPLANDEVRSEQQKILGNLYNQLEEYDEAIASFSNVISFPNSDKEFALINRCYSFLQLNLIVDAKRDCAEARFILSRKVGNGAEPQLHWLVSLGQVESNVSIREGDLPEALESISSAANAVRDSTKELNAEDKAETLLVYLNVLIDEIQILGENKQLDQALSRTRDLLQNANEYFPERVPQILAEEARLHTAQGNFDQAGSAFFAAYETALQNTEGGLSEINHHQLIFFSCMSYLRSAQISETLEACRELHNSETDNPNFLELYGLSLAKAQKADEAVDVFNQILLMTPSNQARYRRVAQRVNRLIEKTLD